MWCKHCQITNHDSDEAFAHAGTGCSHCRDDPAAALLALRTRGKSHLRFGSWELEDDLRHSRRLIDLVKGVGLPSGEDQVVRAATSEPVDVSRREPQRVNRDGGGLSWFVLCLASATFVGGGVLLGWSHFADRPDLWRMGLPLALVGQAAFIVGLALQLESFRRGNVPPQTATSELDRQLHSCDRTSSATSTHVVHSPSNPHLVLADVKGRLDVLARQLG